MARARIALGVVAAAFVVAAVLALLPLGSFTSDPRHPSSCGRGLAGTAVGVRFLQHPGPPAPLLCRQRATERVDDALATAAGGALLAGAASVAGTRGISRMADSLVARLGTDRRGNGEMSGPL